MLYVDQWNCVKYISSNLRTKWLDVFFNLTKGMTRLLRSDQFWNIELDNKLYSFEHQSSCFYVGPLIHW